MLVALVFKILTMSQWIFVNMSPWIHVGKFLKGVCFLSGSVVKNLPANSGDMDLIPGLGRSPGERNGNPFQYSCLGNPMDRGDWGAIVHEVTKSWTRLSDWITTTYLEKELLSWSYGYFQPFCRLQNYSSKRLYQFPLQPARLRIFIYLYLCLHLELLD